MPLTERSSFDFARAMCRVYLYNVLEEVGIDIVDVDIEKVTKVVAETAAEDISELMPNPDFNENDFREFIKQTLTGIKDHILAEDNEVLN